MSGFLELCSMYKLLLCECQLFYYLISVIMAESQPFIKIWFSQLHGSIYGRRIPKDSWCEVSTSWDSAITIIAASWQSLLELDVKFESFSELSFVVWHIIISFVFQNLVPMILKADNPVIFCKICCSGPLWGFVVGFMLFNIKGIAYCEKSRWKLFIILSIDYKFITSPKNSPWIFLLAKPSIPLKVGVFR